MLPKDQSTFFFVFHITEPVPSFLQAPLPPPKWTTPYEATDQRIICPQIDCTLDFRKYFNIQENCLIANIYVPDTMDNNLPVIVHIHAGAYQVGFGLMSQRKNLVKQRNFIIVNFNHRLGPTGFLCLGTKDIPGNAGLKDQVALLRWVKKNIAGFGGNPDDVTLSGESAGSSAVDLLMLSKATDGLFNKVIPESGANVAVWSVQINPIENAKNFATQLNFTNTDDVYALEEFYKTASYDLLESVSVFLRTDNHFVFTPCIERDVGDERILDDAPIKILKEGNYKKVPMLYGFTDMEGIFRIEFGYDQWKDKMNENFSDFIPADLKFNSYEEKEEVAKRVKEYYFGDKAIGDNTIVSYINYFSDILFLYPVLRAVTLHIEAGHDNVYLYEYSFPNLKTPTTPKVMEIVKGAEHCAQSKAVSDGSSLGQDESNLPENLIKMKSIMRDIWFNFITTG